MDFLDPKKKRAHRIQLFTGYALMAVALGISTWILGTITLGYYWDRKTHTIIQNGLVFVDAHPVSADVYLNGKPQGNTATRLTVPAGQYTLELKHSGYRTWQRGFTLSGAGVERFVYPFLFPEKLVTQDVTTYAAAPGLVTETADRHWLIVEQGASLTNFDQIDLTTTTNTPSLLNFGADLFTLGSGGHHLELVEWASDNRHALVKHTYNDGGAVEFIMLDREQPAASLNLAKAFPDINMHEVKLHDKHFDRLYVLDATTGTLLTLDTKSKAAATVATHIITFKPSGSDQVLYVTADGAPTGMVLAKLKDGAATYNLRNLPPNTTYLLDMANFSSSSYVLVGATSDGKVYEYKDPINDFKRSTDVAPTPVALLKVDNLQAVSFSQNVRFAEAQGGGKFAVYDAETDRQYRYDTKLVLGPLAKAKWMDGHRLVAINEGKVTIFDYDGTNLQTLSAATPGYDVAFDHDYAAFFTVAPSTVTKDGAALTRTELKVKE